MSEERKRDCLVLDTIFDKKVHFFGVGIWLGTSVTLDPINLRFTILDLRADGFYSPTSVVLDPVGLEEKGRQSVSFVGFADLNQADKNTVGFLASLSGEKAQKNSKHYNLSGSSVWSLGSNWIIYLSSSRAPIFLRNSLVMESVERLASTMSKS